MKPALKKLYLIGFLFLALFCFLAYRQCNTLRQITVKYTDKPLIDELATDIPLDPADPLLGNQGAAITVVEFADLNTDLGRKVHRQLSAYISTHPTQMRLIWKDLPASDLFTSNKYLTHQGAFCAQKQSAEQFWGFIDAVILFNKKPDAKQLAAIAEQNKINIAAWQNCLNSTEAVAHVEASVSLGTTLGSKSGPVVYINNKKVNFIDEINIDDLLTEVTKIY